MTASDFIEDILAKRGEDAMGRRPAPSDTTVAHYRRTLVQLMVQAGVPNDLDAVDRVRCVMSWFPAQSGRWKPAVIRHHHAVLA